VNIAKQSAPSFIDKDDWQTITDPIIGDEDVSPSLLKNGPDRGSNGATG